MSRGELEALLAKYEALAQLRRERETAEGTGRTAFEAAESSLRRSRMRAVAEAFPGALRELEVFDAAALEARAEGVRRAIETGSAERWMIVASRFHHLVREGRAGVGAPKTSLQDAWNQVAQESGQSVAEAEALVFGRALRGRRPS